MKKIIELNGYEFVIEDNTLTDVYVGGEKIALGVLEEILEYAEDFRKGKYETN